MGKIHGHVTVDPGSFEVQSAVAADLRYFESALTGMKLISFSGLSHIQFELSITQNFMLTLTKIDFPRISVIHILFLLRASGIYWKTVTHTIRYRRRNIFFTAAERR